MKKLMILSAVLAAISAQAQVTNTDRLILSEVTKYGFMAQNGGSFVDLCVQAGIIKAAAAQANQAQIYANWSKQEEYVCKYLDGHMQDMSLRDWAHAAATEHTGRMIKKPAFYSAEAGPDKAGKPILYPNGKQYMNEEKETKTDPAKEEAVYKSLLDQYLAAVPQNMR